MYLLQCCYGLQFNNKLPRNQQIKHMPANDFALVANQDFLLLLKSNLSPLQFLSQRQFINAFDEPRSKLPVNLYCGCNNLPRTIVELPPRRFPILAFCLSGFHA